MSFAALLCRLQTSLLLTVEMTTMSTPSTQLSPHVMLFAMSVCSTLVLLSTAETTSLAPAAKTADSNTTTPSPEERRMYLASLQEESNKRHIPAIVYLAALAVIGTPGNILVILVYKKYMKQSPLRIFIMAIAGFDLVTNVLAIPGEIYNILHSWDFNMPGFCKARKYVMAFTVGSSALILVAVAVTRYRKVCKPFKAPVTIRQAKITCVAVIFIGLLCAFPFLVFYGVLTKATPRSDIHGTGCSAGDAYLNTMWPFLTFVLYLIVFFSTCIPIVALYSLIGTRACKHSSQHGTGAVSKSTASSSITKSGFHDGRGRARSSQDDTEYVEKGDFVRNQIYWPRKGSNYKRFHPDDFESVELSSVETEKVLSVTSSCTTVYEQNYFAKKEVAASKKEIEDGFCDKNDKALMTMTNSALDRHVSRISETGNGRWDGKAKDLTTRKSGKRRMNKVTIVLFLISAVFIIGFVPHFVSVLIILTDREGLQKMTDTDLYFYNLFLRSHYLNCAANPIIYGLVDARFRRFTLKLFGCTT